MKSPTVGPSKLNCPHYSPSFLIFITASVAIPALTNLRTLARNGKLPEDDADYVLNSLPVPAASIVDVFLRHGDVLLTEFSHDVGIPFHISVLETIKKDYSYIIDSDQVVYFDDENNEDELVYAIAVNR